MYIEHDSDRETPIDTSTGFRSFRTPRISRPTFILSLIIGKPGYDARERGKMVGEIEEERMSDHCEVTAGYSSMGNFPQSFFTLMESNGRLEVSR